MTDLSPAAQAVLDAFRSSHTGQGCLAAALRALADHQQAPITDGQPIDHWSPDERTRRELQNIAFELDSHHGYRNLVLQLAGHMGYMQDQLEAYHQLDDLDNYYWYRESVALRQQMADVLAADGQARAGAAQ